MKTFLTYFAGVLTASAWWAAALFGRGNLGLIWLVPSFLTLFSLIIAIEIAINEE